MDRMPKEYKISVYILLIGLVYFVIFSYSLFMRFKIVESSLSKYLVLISIFVLLVYFIPSIMLLRKIEISRNILLTIVALNILVNAILCLLMLNFKSFVIFLTNHNLAGAFTPYLVLGIARLTPEKIIAILLIQIPWLGYLLYLLRHKEVKVFLKTKQYPLVNTQRYTLGVLVLFFICLSLISLIFGL